MSTQENRNRTGPLNLSRFCQLGLNRMLVARLPYPWSRAYLRRVGRLYHRWHQEEAELIRRTAAMVLTPMEPTVYDRIFTGIYDHYLEKLFVAYAPLVKLAALFRDRLRLPSMEELEQARQAGRGVILVTGHFGAVEFLPAALQLQGLPTAIIVRPQTQKLAASFRERAALIDLSLIYPETGQVFSAALQALRAGRILITEGDEFREWRPDHSRRLSFLGCSLTPDRTLEVLRQRSGAPVFGALLARDPADHYQLHLKRLAPEGGSTVGELFLAWLAQAIQRAPEQWYQWAGFGRYLRQSSPPSPALPGGAAPARKPLYCPVPAH